MSDDHVQMVPPGAVVLTLLLLSVALLVGMVLGAGLLWWVLAP